MIILWNRSKAKTKYLRALLKEVARRIGYSWPVIIIVKTQIREGLDGEAHQMLCFPWFHHIDLRLCPEVNIRKFLGNIIHEFRHVMDYDHDPERTKMEWSCQTGLAKKTGDRGPWHERPEEIRAMEYEADWVPGLLNAIYLSL